MSYGLDPVTGIVSGLPATVVGILVTVVTIVGVLVLVGTLVGVLVGVFVVGIGVTVGVGTCVGARVGGTDIVGVGGVSFLVEQDGAVQAIVIRINANIGSILFI